MPQRLYPENSLSFNGQLPIRHKIVTMDLYPCLDQFQLVCPQFSAQNCPIRKANNSTLAAILDMNMGCLVLIVIKMEHPYNDSVKYRYDRHFVAHFNMLTIRRASASCGKTLCEIDGLDGGSFPSQGGDHERDAGPSLIGFARHKAGAHASSFELRRSQK